MSNDEEFALVVRSVFRNLRDWSGESFRSTPDDSPDLEYKRSLIDPGKMALLRRGRLRRGLPVAIAASVIDPMVPQLWGIESDKYLALYRATMLYTMHPHSTRRSAEKKFGQPITSAFRKANEGKGGEDDESRANDRRINLLLDAQSDEIYGRLERIIEPLMNRSEEGVDWLQLAFDLRDWGEPVRLRWSGGWYRAPRFLLSDALDSESVDENHS